MKEADLIREAVQVLAETTGVELELIEHEYKTDQGRYIDALARINGDPNQNIFAIEAKQNLTTAKAGQAIEQLQAVPFKGMLVTDFVNPKMAERLKEMNIAFIDLAGNAYINNAPVYIYIRGNRPLAKPGGILAPKPTRAFQATGLKVVFGFLIKPDLVHAPYRTIAEFTDVALGTVGWVINDLKTHGFLLDAAGKRRLIRRKELLDMWVEAYPEKLKPKLFLGRYQARNKDWWRNADVKKYHAMWGGEVAAAIITNYLKPYTATIYTPENPALMLLENQLRKDPDGNVEVLKMFWKPNGGIERQNDKKQHGDCAPYFLVYAELIATADQRNIETAKIIYDEYLHRYFE